MMADGCSICDVCLPPARPRSQVPALQQILPQSGWSHTTDVDTKYVRTRAAEMDPKSTPQLTFS